MGTGEAGVGEIFDMCMDRGGEKGEKDVLRYEVVWWLLSNAGKKKPSKEQFHTWWRGAPIDFSHFRNILAEAREPCGHGSPEAQLMKLRGVFFHEIFAMADTSRDGKIQKNEVLALLQCVTEADPPVTEADVVTYMRQSGGGGGKTIDFQSFPLFCEGMLMESRSDITLPVLHRAALALNGKRKLNKEKKSPGIFDRISLFGGQKKNPDPAPDTENTSTQDLSAGRGRNSIPVSPQTGAKWDGMSSPRDRASVVSTPREPGSAYTNDLLQQLAAKNAEVSRLTDQVQELNNYKELNEEGLLMNKIKELEQTCERLNGALSRFCGIEAERDNLVEQHNKLLEDLGENEVVVDELELARRDLEAKLEKERENNLDMKLLRRRETEELTLRKSENARHKAQIDTLRKEVQELRDAVEQKDYELEKLKASQHDGLRNASIRSGVFESMLGASHAADSDCDEDANNEIVFLNPPKHVETVAMQSTTIFDAPLPIYYVFPKQIKPTQLVIDMKLNSATHPVEYIACRDADRQRSLSAYVDHGALHIPTAPIPYQLPVNEWVTLSVTFSWMNKYYALSIGGQKLCTEQPFRDGAAQGILALDVYPRTQAAITYSNIRFLLC